MRSIFAVVVFCLASVLFVFGVMAQDLSLEVQQSLRDKAPSLEEIAVFADYSPPVTAELPQFSESDPVIIAPQRKKRDIQSNNGPLAHRLDDEASDGQGISVKGGDLRLSQVNPGGSLVIIFYKGGWSSSCVSQLVSFQSRLKDIELLGAKVVAVSIDSIDSSKETVKKNKITYDVISDSDASIIKDYQLAHVEKNNKNLANLIKYSGRTDALLSLPAVFVVDTDSLISFAEMGEGEKRVSPQEVIDVLKSGVSSNNSLPLEEAEPKQVY